MDKINTSARKASDFVVESFDGSMRLNLPPLIKFDQIPDVRNEISTKDIVNHFLHLTDIASCFPPIDDESDVSLLIGRDLPEAHHFIKEIVGPKCTPFAQKLVLGWTLIGEFRPTLNLRAVRQGKLVI